MELSQAQIHPLKSRAQEGSWDAVPWDKLLMVPRWGVRRPGAAGHPEKAMPHTRTSSSALLFSTYNSPCQELVPEGSPFLQAEQDTPCKPKTHLHKGPCHIPLATAPAEHPGFIPGCVLTLPRPPHTQAHQAISDVLITAKPPHGHSPSQGGKIWDLRQMSPLPLGSTNTCMA